jgi:hypothetical protein
VAFWNRAFWNRRRLLWALACVLGILAASLVSWVLATRGVAFLESPAFLESVGITALAAALTACWHSLGENEKPDAHELAIGPDLIVATMVLQAGLIPGSHVLVTEFRWAGLVALFCALAAMALFTKKWGYKQDSGLYRRDESTKARRYIPVERMTVTWAWVTSIAGCLVLGVFWWLNVNIGLVVSVWKGAFH